MRLPLPADCILQCCGARFSARPGSSVVERLSRKPFVRGPGKQEVEGSTPSRGLPVKLKVTPAIGIIFKDDEKTYRLS